MGSILFAWARGCGSGLVSSSLHSHCEPPQKGVSVWKGPNLWSQPTWLASKALSKLHDAEHGPAGWMWPQVNKTNSIKSGLTPYLSAPRPVPPSKGFGFPESQAEPLPPSNHAEAIRHTKMESYLDNLTVSDITQLVGEGCLILELLS